MEDCKAVSTKKKASEKKKSKDKKKITETYSRDDTDLVSSGGNLSVEAAHLKSIDDKIAKTNCFNCRKQGDWRRDCHKDSYESDNDADSDMSVITKSTREKS